MITLHTVSIDGVNREESISININDIVTIHDGDGTNGLRRAIGAKSLVLMNHKDMMELQVKESHKQILDMIRIELDNGR